MNEQPIMPEPNRSSEGARKIEAMSQEINALKEQVTRLSDIVRSMLEGQINLLNQETFPDSNPKHVAAQKLENLNQAKKALAIAQGLPQREKI